MHSPSAGLENHSGIHIGNALSLGWAVQINRGFTSGMHYPSAELLKSYVDSHRECTILPLGHASHSGMHIGNALSLGWAV